MRLLGEIVAGVAIAITLAIWINLLYTLFMRVVS